VDPEEESHATAPQIKQYGPPELGIDDDDLYVPVSVRRAQSVVLVLIGQLKHNPTTTTPEPGPNDSHGMQPADMTADKNAALLSVSNFFKTFSPHFPI
jgi:hypothetical protein